MKGAGGSAAGDGAAPLPFLGHFSRISGLPRVSVPYVQFHPSGASGLGRVTDFLLNIRYVPDGFVEQRFSKVFLENYLLQNQLEPLFRCRVPGPTYELLG